MPTKNAGWLVLSVGLMAGNAFAGNLSSYANGDVLLCFRKPQGANDLVVDLGPASSFVNASPNTRMTFSQYTGNQLALVGTNGIAWSVFTWYGATTTPASAQWTLFVSNPRTSLDTQSDPPPQATQSSQHLAGNVMAAIPKGAYDNYVTHTYNAASTATAVIEPDNNSNPNYTTGQSYYFALSGGTTGTGDLNFQDTYGSFPENNTPGNFTLAGTPERSDFYWIPPAIPFTTPAPVVFLGYFELNTNGVMSYVAYPPAVPATPVIQSITRTNNISYITFTTGSFGTYTLRGASSLTSGTAPTNWPAISSISGSGSVSTLTDPNSAATMFYIISAN